MHWFRRPIVVIGVAAIALFVFTQTALGFLLRPALERQMRYIFRAPVHIDQAGANVLAGSIWMKDVRVKNSSGFKERDVLTVRRLSINLSILSLLTSKLVVSRIKLVEPVFYVEISKSGQMNLLYFSEQVARWSEKFLKKTRRLLRLITSYELEKFWIANGRVLLTDARQPKHRWEFRLTSFSLARLMYPPDPQEALPAALYVHAVVQSKEKGQVLVIGRFNPFADRTSFDMTASFKDLVLSDYEYFFPVFPLTFADGILQLKVKALCHENQADLDHQVRVEKLKFHSPLLSRKLKQQLVFGLPPTALAHFFNELRPVSEPFEFHFRVTGRLDDPEFDLISEVRKRIRQEIYDQVTAKMKSLTDGTQRMVEKALVEPVKHLG